MELPYWIEHDENNLSRNKIWVKIPSLESGEFAIVTIRKTPGYSPSADTVFDFFDDFSGTAVDQTRWSILYDGVPYSVSDSKLYVQLPSNLDPNALALRAHLPFELTDTTAPGYIFEGWIKAYATPNPSDTSWILSGIGVGRSSSTGKGWDNLFIVGWDGRVDQFTLHAWCSGYYGTAIPGVSNNTWYLYQLHVLSNSKAEGAIGGNWVTLDAPVGSGTYYFQIGGQTPDVEYWFEWVRVRKHTDTPPSVTLLSSSETTAVFRVVNNSHQTLTDYQIAFDAPFDVATDESLEVVLEDSEVNFDGWIEHDQSGNPGRYFWVRVPQLPAGTTSFYVVRVKNKPTLRNIQNAGQRTFPIFDDFESDLSSWYTGGNGATHSISDGRLHLSCSGTTASSWVGHKTSPPYDSYIIETIWYWNSDGTATRSCGVGLCNPFDAGGDYGCPSYTVAHQSEYDHTWRLARTTPTSYSLATSTSINSSTQKWWWVRFYVVPQSSDVLYRGEMESDSESASVEVVLGPASYNSPFLFVAHYGANLTEGWFEWVFVRRYVEPFPTVSVTKALETDTEVYYEVTISNSGSDITDIQIPIPLTHLEYTSFNDELYITDSLPQESTRPNLTDATFAIVAGKLVQDSTYLFVRAFRFTKELQIAGDLSTYAKIAGWLRTELSKYVAGLEFSPQTSKEEGSYVSDALIGGTLKHTYNRFIAHLKFMAEQEKEQGNYSGWIYLFGTPKYDYVVRVQGLQFTPEILEVKPEPSAAVSSSKTPQFPSVQSDISSILVKTALKGTASFTDSYSLGGAQFSVSFTDRYDIYLLTDPVYHTTIDGFVSHSEDESHVTNEVFASYVEAKAGTTASDETPLHHTAVIQLLRQITASFENAVSEDVEFYGMLHASAVTTEEFRQTTLVATAETQDTGITSPARDAGCVQIVEGVLVLSKDAATVSAQAKGSVASVPKWQFALVQADSETKGSVLLAFIATDLNQNATWIPLSITYPKADFTITANLGPSPTPLALNSIALVRLAQYIFLQKGFGVSRKSYNALGLRAKVLVEDNKYPFVSKPLSLYAENTYNLSEQTEYALEVVMRKLADAAKVIPTPCAQPVQMSLETPYDVWTAIHRTIKTLVEDFTIEPFVVAKFLAYDASLLGVFAKARWVSYTKDIGSLSKALAVHSTTSAQEAVAKYLYLDTSKNKSVAHSTGIVIEGEMELATPPESTGIELAGNITKMEWYWTFIVLNMTRQCAQPAFGFKTASHSVKQRYPKVRVVLKDASGNVLWSYTLKFVFKNVYRDRIPSYTTYVLKNSQKKKLVGARTILMALSQKPSHFVARRDPKVFPVIYPAELQPPKQGDET